MLANFCILTVFQEIRTYHCWQKSMKIYFLDLETGTTLSLRAEVYHEIKLGKNRRENECKVWHNLDHCGTIHWKMDCTKESAIVILPDSKEEGFWKLQYHTLGLVFKSDVSFCSTAVKSIYWTVKLQSNDSEILNCSKNTLFLWTTLTECKVSIMPIIKLILHLNTFNTLIPSFSILKGELYVSDHQLKVNILNNDMYMTCMYCACMPA